MSTACLRFRPVASMFFGFGSHAGEQSRTIGLAAAPGQNPRWACHRGLDLLDECEWYEFWVLSVRYVV
jgi:hypothetical protein